MRGVTVHPHPPAPVDHTLHTKARIMDLLAGGSDFNTICREVGVAPPRLLSHLTGMRRDGLVTFRDSVGSIGISDLHLTATGVAKSKRIRDEVIAHGVAHEVLAGPPRIQTTLSPVAPRRTLETAVVSISTGRAARRKQATDPTAHGSVAEGGPVTVTHPAPSHEVPVAAPSHEAEPVFVLEVSADLLDGLPLIADIAARGERRRQAEAAAVLLEAAGLTDLALDAMTALPEDSPLDMEVMVLLARVRP